MKKHTSIQENGQSFRTEKRAAVGLLIAWMSGMMVKAGTLKLEATKPVPSYSTTNVVQGTSDRQPGFNFATADFNKDGRLDLALITFTYNPTNDTFNRGTVTVYLQAPDGTFPRSADYLINPRPGITVWGDNMFAADFDQDGNLDLLTDDFGGTDMRLLLGRGDGTFKNPQTLGLSVSERQVAIGDINGDSRLDILVGAAGSGVSIYLGQGNGAFDYDRNLPTSTGEVRCILPADLSKDNDLDLVVITTSFGTRNIEVFRASNPGEFGQGIVTYTGLPEFRARASEIADLNGDGDLDYIGLNRDESTVQIWLGQSEGNFVYQADYDVGADAWKVFVGDINADGIQDLMVDASWGEAETRPVSILLGNGDGSFQAQRKFDFTGGMARRPRLADMNGDGRPDLLAMFATTSAGPVAFDFVLGLNQGCLGDPTLGFLISMEDESGLPTSLEASTDLIAWDPIFTNRAPAGMWRYIDSAAGLKQRFYRTRRP